MTIEELYKAIGGDYEKALSVLRIEKLIDKHIRKFPKSGVIGPLIAAAETMDNTALFEAAHAIKGVCSNLGLVAFVELASQISEEYRPGNTRKFSDGEVKEKIGQIKALYQNAVKLIGEYEAASV